MQIRSSTIAELLQELQEIVNQPIWRVIHPADGWLLFDIGRQYMSSFADEKGRDIPYAKGEFQLVLKGDWRLFNQDTLVAERQVEKGESSSDYFSRMQDLEDNFPLKQFTGISLEDDTLILKGGDVALKVSVDDKNDSVSLTKVTLGAGDHPVSYTHVRFDDEVGSLAFITA